MSNAPGPSFSQQHYPSQPVFASKGTPLPVSAPWPRSTVAPSVPSATSSAVAPPDTFPADASSQPTFASVNGSQSQSKKSFNVRLTAEDERHASEVSSRVSQCLLSHHMSTLLPDIDSPFESAEDAVNRLLPYHIFQHPKEDTGKGKRKATEADLLKEEIKDTRQALQFHKRRQALENRFRRARIKSGKRTAPDDQAYFLAQAVLEGDRAETTALTAELRNARAELDKIERDKRQAAMPPRAPYYASTMSSTPAYSHHYRYHYPYAQQSGALTQTPISSDAAMAAYNQSRLNSSSSNSSTPAYTPASYTAPTSYNSAASGTTQAPVPASPATQAAPATPTKTSIPVQLPIASLPALHALGIMPVPAASVPALSSGQLPPAAVLREASPDGRFLTLEINVPSLQPNQMSGLAVVLNSLARGTNGTATATSGTTPTSTVPPTSYPVYHYSPQYTVPQTQPTSGYSTFHVNQSSPPASGGSTSGS